MPYFFLLTMKAYQFDIENVPFMSDRGHFLAAVRFLYKVSNIVIIIKFFLEHIIRHVIGRYETPKEKVSTLRKALNGMQSASTYDRFCKKMEMLHTMDLSESNEIILYMLRIHPRHWTTFGNRSDIPDSR